jgi:3-oxoacyl-[acyl-carrier protein] reductase
VLTMVRTTRAALPLLRQATFARVVNVAASSIRHQSPGLIGFTASKAAMASASKNLSRALAPEGIIVNTVAPGTVMSPTLAGYLVGTDLEGLPEGPLEAAYEAIARDYGASNDIGRVGLPEEVATMVVFLCSELCSFVVGATVPVDGGTDFF